MEFVYNFTDFINEELTKLPSTYNFSKGKTSEKADQNHNRLASKKDDGHEWKKFSVRGQSKSVKTYRCKCGYEKKVELTRVGDKDKSVSITYSKK
mgnify:FL=1